MTREEAFKSMTSWAARACFFDGVAGTLEPGKYADFVVLDRDPMRTAPEEIMSTRVLATFSGGERVYAAPIAAAAAQPLRARGRRNGTCCGAHA
jgi:hypothetical protein